jgi:phosphate acetyltransferase
LIKLFRQKILDQRKPNFLYDGELRFDAAMIPAIGEKKAPRGVQEMSARMALKNAFPTGDSTKK